MSGVKRIDPRRPYRITPGGLRRIVLGEVGSGDAFSTPVLRLWAAASPPLRIAAAQFLTGRAEWQQRLLAALEQPDPSTSVLIKPRDLPATTRRFFATNPDPALRAAA